MLRRLKFRVKIKVVNDISQKPSWAEMRPLSKLVRLVAATDSSVCYRDPLTNTRLLNNVDTKTRGKQTVLLPFYQCTNWVKIAAVLIILYKITGCVVFSEWTWRYIIFSDSSYLRSWLSDNKRKFGVNLASNCEIEIRKHVARCVHAKT